MTGRTKRIVAWDSCIFLAWLKNESDKHGKDAIEAIRAMIEEMESKKLTIVTSVITEIEVLDSFFNDSELLSDKPEYEPACTGCNSTRNCPYN